MIIALGESIVATGSGLDATGLTAGVVTTAIAGLVIAAAQWWAYFDVVALVAGRRFAVAESGAQARLARDSYGVLHLLLIAGVVLVALGLKKALLHIDEPLETVPAVALCGGAALYLIGHVAFRLRNIGTLNRQRLFAAVILLALIPFATSVDAAGRRDRGGDRPRRPDRLRDDPLPRVARPGPPRGRRQPRPPGRRGLGWRRCGSSPSPTCTATSTGAARLVELSADADVVIGAGDFASVHEGLAETIDALAAIEVADGARPRQQRDRGRAARRRRRLGVRPPSSTARAPRSTGSSSSASAPGSRSPPGTGASTSTEDEAAERLAGCPEGAVLVVHSPPKGHVDASSAGDHLGSAAILAAIEAKQPRLAVCGHIHESWGASSTIGETPVRNLGPEGTFFEL